MAAHPAPDSTRESSGRSRWGLKRSAPLIPFRHRPRPGNPR
jgi:hypothetical protein